MARQEIPRPGVTSYEFCLPNPKYVIVITRVGDFAPSISQIVSATLRTVEDIRTSMRWLPLRVRADIIRSWCSPTSLTAPEVRSQEMMLAWPYTGNVAGECI